MSTPITTFAGYYTRTQDNLPLVCPLTDEGLHVIAGLSGYGTMSACAAGALCVSYMNGSDLPGYARYFHIDRYHDPELKSWMVNLSNDGQL